MGACAACGRNNRDVGYALRAHRHNRREWRRESPRRFTVAELRSAEEVERWLAKSG
jgi:hypothetical protein